MASDSIKQGGGAEQPQLDGTNASTANSKPTPRKKSSAGGANEAGMKSEEQTRPVARGVSATSIFAIPAPLKELFDHFPLVTYAENALPARSRRSRRSHALYIFTRKADEESGRPSFNPSCLKWQTCLKIAGVEFNTVSSNNHASPSGALPFLLAASDGAASTEASLAPEIVPGNKLKRWMRDQKTARTLPEPKDMRYEAYTSLLDSCIRRAWLYQLYLLPANGTVVRRLYIEPCSSNPFVQMAITSQLRSAAEKEIIKSSGKYEIAEAEIMHDAEEAFQSLSTLLGKDEWLLSAGSPGLFDASLFAYTHLILADLIEWNANPLGDMLRKFENLVAHQRRIREMYY